MKKLFKQDVKARIVDGGTQEIMYFLNEQWWVVNPNSTTRILCITCKYYGWGVVCQPPTLGKHAACYLDCWQALDYWLVRPGNNIGLQTILQKWLSLKNSSVELYRDILNLLQYLLILFPSNIWHLTGFIEYTVRFTVVLPGKINVDVNKLRDVFSLFSHYTKFWIFY